MPSDAAPEFDLSNLTADQIEKAISVLLCSMIEDLTLGVCFEVHRAIKFGYFPLEEYVVINGEFIQYNPALHRNNQADFLTLAAASKKPTIISCPHCNRKIGTYRFAPHLNSCMGEGRAVKKDRNAKRNYATYDSGDDDDDEDYSDSGKKKKKKPAKNARKNNKLKGKAVQIHVFLAQKCGVISRKSKSMCNNTLKCSIHSEEQRREIRQTLLKVEPESNVHIDVDTVDEAPQSPYASSSDLSSLDSSSLSGKLEDINITPDDP